MEVKGTAVESIPIFVKKKFSDRFEEWLNSLSETSQKIMREKILPSSWYPLREAIIIPTQKICELFYKSVDEGAWEAGRFSADYALHGIYKWFVKIGSPGFIISRASTIFSTYYKPSEMKPVENFPKRAVVHITHFPEPNRLIELRIGGWIERALEISGCKDLKVEITKSLTKGDPVTEFVMEWK